MKVKLKAIDNEEAANTIGHNTGAVGYIATTVNGAVAGSFNDSAFGDEHSSEWIRNIQDPQIKPFYNNLMGCFLLTPNP